MITALCSSEIATTQRHTLGPTSKRRGAGQIANLHHRNGAGSTIILAHGRAMSSRLSAACYDWFGWLCIATGSNGHG